MTIYFDNEIVGIAVSLLWSLNQNYETNTTNVLLETVDILYPVSMPETDVTFLKMHTLTDFSPYLFLINDCISIKM